MRIFGLVHAGRGEGKRGVEPLHPTSSHPPSPGARGGCCSARASLWRIRRPPLRPRPRRPPAPPSHGLARCGTSGRVLWACPGTAGRAGVAARGGERRRRGGRPRAAPPAAARAASCEPHRGRRAGAAMGGEEGRCQCVDGGGRLAGALPHRPARLSLRRRLLPASPQAFDRVLKRAGLPRGAASAPLEEVVVAFRSKAHPDVRAGRRAEDGA